ncbi:response regulator [Vineibacter terrae]|uniref:response regulator n=1 Tax=Vineibacter terrae TaxID=2586908 RepID=UPI002E312A8D|nr:response regulator [Vineibacter terrae]HEX2889336.1 response regulator [Vineibacter terrae]
MKILLVDDEAELVAELSGFLHRRGHGVTAADGAPAAIRALSNDGPFDVVITDMRMPDGSGFDVVHACMGRPEPRPAMLVMSGHAAPDEISRIRAEGAQHFFPKPLALRELASVLAGIATHRGDTAGARVRQLSAV